MNRDDRWLGDIMRGAIDPGQVESTLQQIRENWPPNSLPLRELIEDFPLGAESLSHSRASFRALERRAAASMGFTEG